MTLALAVASSALAMQGVAPSVETAFIAALAAGDSARVESMLADDVTIMDEQSGRPEASTAARMAAFLRSCQGEVQYEDRSSEPGRAAFNIGWTCPGRGQTDMLLWIADGKVVAVQLGRLAPTVAETVNG